MKKGDTQIGFPSVLYKNTKANIEALSGVPEGAVTYATDTDEFGSYNGTIWTWGQGSALIEDAINNGVTNKAPSENAVFDALALKEDVANKDTDGTLAANSDTKYPSQKAIKTYVDNLLVGLLEFKGSTDCSANPNYPAASKGDAYYVTVAGKIGGASGKSVDVGDVYVASADNAGGTETSVGTSWFVLEHNLQGALLAANNLNDVASASSARSNLGLGALAVLSSLAHSATTGQTANDHHNQSHDHSAAGDGQALAPATTFALGGIISPSNISSDQNDYNPTGLSTASVIRVQSTTDVNITGIEAAGRANGSLLIFHNIGTGSNLITLKDDDGSSSSAANRFEFLEDQTINPGESIILQYDGTTQRWRMAGKPPRNTSYHTSLIYATVAGMVSSNTETGVKVTSASNKLNFVVTPDLCTFLTVY